MIFLNAEAEVRTPVKLTILTFNIQHGLLYRSDPPRIDLGGAAGVIRSSGADLIGLNEVRGAGEDPGYTDQTESLSSMLGLYGVFGRSIHVRGNNPYGNALLSRFSVRESGVVHIPDPLSKDLTPGFEHRSILRTVVELPDGKPLTVLVTHFGLSPAERRFAVSAVRELADTERHPFVLMGDFNTTPDDPILKPLDGIMREAGPLLEGGTFPSHAPERRIDYLFAGPGVTLERAEVLPVTVSDHRPVRGEVTV